MHRQRVSTALDYFLVTFVRQVNDTVFDEAGRIPKLVVTDTATALEEQVTDIAK
jgi:hypothetical protein